MSLPRPRTVEEALQCLADLDEEVRALRQLLSGMATSGLPRAGASGADRVATPRPECGRPGDCWEVINLGRFEVRQGGRAIPLCRSRRGRGVLAYLLASPGRSKSAEVLLEEFWPEATPRAGAHNLQMAISALRSSLRGHGPEGGDNAILFRADRYLLNPALVIVQDVDRFTAAYERGRQAVGAGHRETARQAFEEARGYYTGDYLADCPYAGWAIGRSGWLKDMYLAGLEHLSVLYAETANWDLVTTYCHEIVTADPYREAAYCQLMRAQSATGQFAAAQRTFETCRERLWQELRVPPAPETVAVYRTLLTARGVPAEAKI